MEWGYNKHNPNALLLQLSGAINTHIFLPHRLHPIRLNLLPAAGHAATDRSHSQLFVSIRQHTLWIKLPGSVRRSNRHLLLFWRDNTFRFSMCYTDSLCDGQLFLPNREHAFRSILLSTSCGGDGQLYLPGRKCP